MKSGRGAVDPISGVGYPAWQWNGVISVQCPQCGVETPDDEWNCVSCRINLYWASQHYQRLADIRDRQGLPSSPSSAPFLVKAHKDAMDDRADRGGRVEHRVRRVARKVMGRQS